MILLTDKTIKESEKNYIRSTVLRGLVLGSLLNDV